jgi:hypothetical protein
MRRVSFLQFTHSPAGIFSPIEALAGEGKARGAFSEWGEGCGNGAGPMSSFYLSTKAGIP